MEKPAILTIYSRGKMTLDSEHFHPTEVIYDKISSLLLFLQELMLHLSRLVRWDSDHVVILNDELQAIAQEIVRTNSLEPIVLLREYEANGHNFERIALLEEAKSFPWASVFDYYCLKKCIIPGETYIKDIQQYEKDETNKRL